MVVEARPWLADPARRYPFDYALVDVETTGLDPTTDRIVQVAVAHVSAHGVLQRSWSTLVNPGCDPGATEIHGLTRHHLADAPGFHAVAAELAGLLGSRILVAHNAVFDWRFLAAESRRAGVRLPVNRRLCTIALARHLDLPLSSMGLPSIASHFDVVPARSHDAIDDMRVLSEILLHLLTAADRVGLALPLAVCDAADAAPAYPVRSPRRACRWVYPGRWSPGGRLVQGMKVAFTGATVAPRETLTARAADAGLDVMNSVSGRTSVMVVNDTSFTSAKMRAAGRHGTSVVDEATFARLLAEIAPGRPVAADPTPTTEPTLAPAPALAPDSAPTTPRQAPRPARPAQARSAPTGPLAGRCLLVLGGKHHEAAEVRARIGTLGGIAAVNLTPRVTGVVPLPGAERERRWPRITALQVPICDLTTFEPTRADQAPAEPSNALAPDPGVPVTVLPRGGVVDLPDDVDGWSISVRWPDLSDATVEVDVVAFLTDADDQVRADSDFVFYNAPASADGAVELTLGIPTETLVDLRPDRIPADVERVTIAAAIPHGHTFSEVGPIELIVRTDSGATHLRATLDAATTEQSMLLSTVYRRNGRWRFRAVGQGYDFGLAELATNHGVAVDD